MHYHERDERKNDVNVERKHVRVEVKVLGIRDAEAVDAIPLVHRH